MIMPSWAGSTPGGSAAPGSAEPRAHPTPRLLQATAAGLGVMPRLEHAYCEARAHAAAGEAQREPPPALPTALEAGPRPTVRHSLAVQEQEVERVQVVLAAAQASRPGQGIQQPAPAQLVQRQRALRHRGAHKAGGQQRQRRALHAAATPTARQLPAA